MLREEIKHYLKNITLVLSVQTIIQLLSVIAGIISVRSLTKQENAYFTISNGFQTSLLVASDLGLTIGLSSLSGKYWANQKKVLQIFSTGNQLRKRLIIISLIISIPLFTYQFIKIHTSFFKIAIFSLLIIIDFIFRIKTFYYNTFYKLEGQVKRIQKIDLISTMIRVIIIIAASLFFLNNSIILISILFAGYCSYYLHRKHFQFDLFSLKNFDAGVNEELKSVVRSQVPYFLYFIFQGQITLFLLAYLGNVNQMADYGALSRFAIIFNVINSVFSIFIGPKFSKENDYNKSLKIYLYSVFSVLLFSVILLYTVYLMPNYYLLILGKKYANLQKEIFVLFISSLVNNINGIIISLNNNKGWMKQSWVIIPATILTQIIFLILKPLHTLTDIINFSIASLIPTTIIYLFMAFRGFVFFKKERGL